MGKSISIDHEAVAEDAEDEDEDEDRDVEAVAGMT